jgi:hemerythrin superfamily protein
VGRGSARPDRGGPGHDHRESDIVRFIRDQHDEIKRRFSKVESWRSRRLRVPGAALAVHEAAEEGVIYPVVRSAEPGDHDHGETAYA